MTPGSLDPMSGLASCVLKKTYRLLLLTGGGYQKEESAGEGATCKPDPLDNPGRAAHCTSLRY